MMMRLLALTVVGFVAIGMISANPAAADCAGPTVTFAPHDVDRGGEVTVTGEYMGDSCYDTGPPPEGQGALGRPLTGVEIVAVQGDMEWVIATVDADEEYRFTAQVTVPWDASPGEAQLLARKPGRTPAVWNPEPVLRISDAPALPPPPTTDSSPRVSGSGSVESASKTEPSAQESQPFGMWLVAAAAVAVGTAAVVSIVVRRRRLK